MKPADLTEAGDRLKELKMRVLRRWVTALVALAVAVVTTPVLPAQAALPEARNEEWWFSSWEVEKKVWPMSRGRGITVALVGTGVNASLPGLRGVVLPGVDFKHAGGDGRTDTDTKKSGGHGTAMAALIAGQGYGAHMVGVAPEAKILPIVRVARLRGYSRAINYAVDHGADVINLSLGLPDPNGGDYLCPSGLQQAVAYAARHDVVVVAAAGNDGDGLNYPNTPADCPGVLAVGAIDSEKRAWTETQRQPYVAVASPGTSVGSIDKHGKFMDYISGTSQAAALTSAAVAIVRSKYPDMSARRVVQKLINTTVDAGPKGHDKMTGYGAIIPASAMSDYVPKNAPNPPYDRLDKWLKTHDKPPLGATPTPTASPTGGTTATDNDSSDSALTTAIIIVASLAILAAIIIVILLLTRHRKNPAIAGPPLSPYPPTGAPPGFPPPGQPPPGPPTPGGPPPLYPPNAPPPPGGLTPQQPPQPPPNHRTGGPPPSFDPPQ